MNQQERVWRELKGAAEPMGVDDLANRLNLGRREVRKALYRMRQWCDVVKDGNGRAARYYVPAGAVYACPGIGNTEGSRRNLRPWNWLAGLRAIQEKRTPTRRVPMPATMLEQCWASMKGGQ